MQNTVCVGANIDIVKYSKGKQKEGKSALTSGCALCNVCSKMFSSEKALKVHIKMHDEYIKCDICCKLFSTIYILKKNTLWRIHKNIATGEMSQAIAPFHFFDNFNFRH